MPTDPDEADSPRLVLNQKRNIMTIYQVTWLTADGYPKFSPDTFSKKRAAFEWAWPILCGAMDFMESVEVQELVLNEWEYRFERNRSWIFHQDFKDECYEILESIKRKERASL